MELIKTKIGYTVVKLTSKEARETFKTTPLMCDMSNKPLDFEEFVVYVPTLNYLVCMNEFKDWEERANFYEEDLVFEKLNLKRYFNI